jgi:hypothetical protein
MLVPVPPRVAQAFITCSVSRSHSSPGFPHDGLIVSSLNPGHSPSVCLLSASPLATIYLRSKKRERLFLSLLRCM